jgi:hypothetical protein
MAGKGSSKAKRGATRSLVRMPLLAATCIVAGLVLAPTVSSAVTGTFQPLARVSLAARGGIGSFTPASADARLAAAITVRGVAPSRVFRFTPAGSDDGSERAITVAVRINPEATRAISVRGVLGGLGGAPGAAAPLRIAPNAFNLGMARGYQSFAGTGGLGTSFARDVQRIDMPDISHFAAASGNAASVSDTPSRLSPRIALDEKERAGRSPRTLESQGNYQVDFGGSYRLTRNLDVTAGIRYSSDRDRLRPLTDGKQDSQAVYLGTQFRF